MHGINNQEVTMTTLILSILLNTQTVEAHVPRTHAPARAHAHHHRTRKPKKVHQAYWVWVSGYWDIRSHRRVWVSGYWELRPVPHYHPPRRR